MMIHEAIVLPVAHRVGNSNVHSISWTTGVIFVPDGLGAGGTPLRASSVMVNASVLYAADCWFDSSLAHYTNTSD